MFKETTRRAGRENCARTNDTAGARYHEPPAAHRNIDTQNISTFGCWGAVPRLRESRP